MTSVYDNPDDPGTDPADSGSNPLAELGDRLLSDVLERFVRPEMQRRISEGSWAEEEGVFLFQVLFHRGAPTEIRLNTGIGGMLTAKVARDVVAGEDVGPADICGIEAYVPREEDRGIGHVTALAHVGGWGLVFEFPGGHEKRHDFLALAAEFIDTARSAVAAGRLHAFVDNAFSATELLARAELLACAPTVDLILDTTNHRFVQRIYKGWADLSNTDPRFPRLLKKLGRLRPRGRYAEGGLNLMSEQATALIELIEEMREHVARLINGDGGLPDRFNVYATRAINAGELVGPGDYSIMPPGNAEQR